MARSSSSTARASSASANERSASPAGTAPIRRPAFSIAWSSEARRITAFASSRRPAAASASAFPRRAESPRGSSERFVERGDGVGGAAHAQEDAAHAHPRQRAVASEPAGLLVVGDRLPRPALHDRDVAAAEGLLVAVGDRVRHGAMSIPADPAAISAWCTAAPCGPASGRTSCAPSCADRARGNRPA